MVSNFQKVRRAVSVAAIGTLAMGMVACSASPDSDSSEASGEIRIGMNASLVPQFEEYAALFESENPEFTVTIQAVPEAASDYIQQLATENLSNSVPDVIFNTGGLNQTLDSNGLLYDLSSWLDEGRSGLEGDSFSPNFLELFAIDGEKITGIPVSADSGVLVYNKTLFEKYGVELPESDWTYEEMHDLASQITTASNGDVYGLVTPLGVASFAFQWYPVLRANGSDVYDADKNEFVFANSAGIEAWTTLFEPYTDEFGVPYASLSNDPGKNLFPSGQAAMDLVSTARIGALRDQMTDDWDVVPMPTIDGVRTTGGGAYSLSISEKSNNKEAAWEFLAWFYSTEGGMEAAKDDGVIPATLEGIESGAWLSNPPATPANFVPAVQTSIEAAILQGPYPAEVAPEVLPALQEAIEKVILRGESIEAAFTEAQDSLNGMLK